MSTAEQKLAELLGIKTDEVPLTHAEEPKRKRAKPGDQRSYAFTAVGHQEIDNERNLQGFLYYLRAPELFTYLKCRECHEPFMVSRRFIAFCSYGCMIKNCRDQGYEWTKGQGDAEVVIKEVFENNEPIWINNPNQMLAVFERTLDIMQQQIDYGPQYTELKEKFRRVREGETSYPKVGPENYTKEFSSD